MKSIVGLFVLLCIVIDDCRVLSATTFRKRPAVRDETSTSSATYENVESSTVRRRASRLSLPSNASSIRSEISDNFSCNGKAYGYYADVENDCQIFHVCLPVTYPDGKGQQFRWSFICPEDTIFNQEAFTCVRTDDMPFSCADSEQFYELNRYLGLRDEISDESISTNDLDATDQNESQLRISDRRQSLRVTSTPTTTTTTSTTTVRPSTTQRKDISRVPIYRRTSTKKINRPTLPSSTATPTTVTTTERYTVPTNSVFEFTEIVEHRENVDATIDRTDSNGNLFETTEFASVTTPSGTTFEDVVTTEGIPVARIVPELIEVGGNDDRTEAKITEDVIQNIKQLQNILPVSARNPGNTQTLDALINSTPAAIEDQRRKRFLFTADAIESRRRLFNRLNPNKS